MTTATSVDLSGPFFQRSPGLTLRGNVSRMMAALAAEGERAAIVALRAGEASRLPLRLSPPRLSGHVTGRVESLTGRHWMASAVVSVHNSGFTAGGATGLMAGAASVERRTHVFRSLGRSIRNSRVVLAANLSEGLE